MPTVAQKFVAGLVLMGVIATIVLPDRQSVGVLNSLFSGGSQLVKTSQGRG